MKKILLLIASVLLVQICATAAPNYNGFSVGYTICNDNRDFGLGLEASTPRIAVGFIDLGARAHIFNNWYSGTTTKTETEDWTPYQNLKFGLFAGNADFAGCVRPYGELGAVMVMTNSDFTKDSQEYGIYGNFGLEFKTMEGDKSPVLYFIEMGANGIFTETTADKIPAEPLYFHGFRSAAGIRWYF